jgi:hypothetical protein
MFEHAALGGISDNDHPLSRVCITDSERLDMPRQAVHGERVACVATPPILLNHAEGWTSRLIQAGASSCFGDQVPWALSHGHYSGRAVRVLECDPSIRNFDRAKRPERLVAVARWCPSDSRVSAYHKSVYSTGRMLLGCHPEEPSE